MSLQTQLPAADPELFQGYSGDWSLMVPAYQEMIILILEKFIPFN